jgi:hypothetical protein
VGLNVCDRAAEGRGSAAECWMNYIRDSEDAWQRKRIC